MKNSFLILFLCITICSFGQEEKPITQGHFLLGGDFVGEYSKQNAFKATQISASPNVGYFVVNNLAVGLTIPIQYVNYESSYSYTAIGLGPYLKYYFNNGLFLSVKTSGSFLKIKDNSYQHYYSSSKSSNGTMFSISPGIGYAWFLNKNVSLEGRFSYEHSKTSGVNSISDSKRDKFQLQIGFQIFL